jgi:hypothetical protein
LEEEEKAKLGVCPHGGSHAAIPAVLVFMPGQHPVDQEVEPQAKSPDSSYGGD